MHGICRICAGSGQDRMLGLHNGVPTWLVVTCGACGGRGRLPEVAVEVPHVREIRPGQTPQIGSRQPPATPSFWEALFPRNGG